MFNDRNPGPSVSLPVVDDIFLDLKAVSVRVPDEIVADARTVNLHEPVILAFDKRVSVLVMDDVVMTVPLKLSASATP